MYMRNNIRQRSMYYLLLVLVGIMTTIQSCQKKDGGSGGSVVGNGFIKYHDKTYDYFFEYAADLKLTQTSSHNLVLQNEEITKAVGLRPSTVNFTVIRLADNEASSLQDYANKVDKNAAWQELNQTNAKGLYKKISTDFSLDAHYIFKLSNELALDVTAQAYIDGRGIELVSHVINSVGMDTTPPTIHEVFFEPSFVRAGESTKLKIRATDNLNEIRSKAPNGSVAIRVEQSCRSLLNSDWETTEVCGSFRALGNDWYEFDIPTHSRMRSGDYVLHPLTLWDGAGNTVELFHDIDKGIYRSSSHEDQSQLPVAYLHVSNDSEDTDAPSLSNARIEPSNIHSGEDAKLIFNSEDNDPNFIPHNFCERALHRNWFKFTRQDLPLNKEFDPTEYSIHSCEAPTRRSDGAWEVRFKTAKGLPPGEYSMDFLIKDITGNKSELSTVTINVANEHQVDRKGPKILTIRTDKESYKQGETGHIYIKATDDISGISDSLNFGVLSFCRQRFVHKKRFLDDPKTTEQISICDSSFKKTGNDWYSMEFTLPEKINTGVYLLPEISIVDNVGNSTILKANLSNSNKASYQNKYSDDETHIPVVHINIIE